MIVKLLLIVITFLSLTLLVGINLLVIIISTQSEILQTKKKVFLSILNYLDLWPQILQGNPAQKELLKQRSVYLSSPNWPTYLTLNKNLNLKLINASQSPVLQDLKQRQEDILALVHEYNSLVIKYQEMLSKKKYKLIKYLDFRYGSRKYEFLDFSA